MNYFEWPNQLRKMADEPGSDNVEAMALRVKARTIGEMIAAVTMPSVPVWHPAYGLGTVIEVTARSAKVKFARSGIKTVWLANCYFRLSDEGG